MVRLMAYVEIKHLRLLLLFCQHQLSPQPVYYRARHLSVEEFSWLCPKNPKLSSPGFANSCLLQIVRSFYFDDHTASNQIPRGTEVDHYCLPPPCFLLRIFSNRYPWKNNLCPA